MVSREEGVFNIPMGGGFLDRPGACRNVGNPGRSVPPFPPSRRLFRAFNGRRVPSPTRRLLEGRESRPRVPVPATTPRLHAARRAAPKKPKKKGILPDALAPLPTELLPIAKVLSACCFYLGVRAGEKGACGFGHTAPFSVTSRIFHYPVPLSAPSHQRQAPFLPFSSCVHRDAPWHPPGCFRGR